MRAVDLMGLNVEVSSGSPVVLLRERDAPHRVLPIFVGGPEAMAIALAVSGESPPRPLTHDLLAALVDSLDTRVDHVEVTEVRDGTFLAELALHSPRGDVSLDSRPSDAIALALRVGAPLFASDAVLDQAAAVLPDDVDDDDGIDEEGTDEEGVDGEEVDDEAIDEHVDRFRSFLAEVDPADFDDPPETDEPH